MDFLPRNILVITNQLNEKR